MAAHIENSDDPRGVMPAKQEQSTDRPSEEQTQGLPALPIAVKDTRATRELMFTLRHFHLGDPGAKSELSPAGDDYLPALLDPFRDTAKLRYDSPLFLAPTNTAVDVSDPAQLATPLSVFLKETVASFAPGEDSARTLKDNLPWVERELRKRLCAFFKRRELFERAGDEIGRTLTGFVDSVH